MFDKTSIDNNSIIHQRNSNNLNGIISAENGFYKQQG